MPHRSMESEDDDDDDDDDGTDEDEDNAATIPASINNNVVNSFMDTCIVDNFWDEPTFTLFAASTNARYEDGKLIKWIF